MNNSSKGRLVWNHSTHIPGLIPRLEKMLTYAGISTVTPGVIGRAKGHSPHLSIRISVPIRGGYKLIARQGKTVQEVFLVTDLTREALEEIIGNVFHND
jgi:hypothetical protein